MQQYAGSYLLQNHSLHVSGVRSTPHQENKKLQLQPLVQVIVPTWSIGHVGGRSLLRYYNLYQRLQLKFYVLLMMGAMDTRNV